MSLPRGICDPLCPSWKTWDISYTYIYKLPFNLAQFRMDCSLPVCFVETTSACTGDGYISNQSSQHIQQNATLVSPNKGKTETAPSLLNTVLSDVSCMVWGNISSD